ncbi:MAG: 30S ribosomal protein S18 [Verrucomicrobia bacterium]|nr:30S ribosomal protein S18 [Verrucomicrobiota bacterium]
MPRKTRPDSKPGKRGSRDRSSSSYGEVRTPRPKPKIDFTVDALDFKNVTLLKQFVTDQGRILPRKYTGLPAHYQRRLNCAIKRARQMLLMK